MDSVMKFLQRHEKYLRPDIRKNKQASARTIKKIIQNCKNFGSVRGRRQKSIPVFNTENDEMEILEYLATYTRMSTRQVAIESGISQSSILKISRKQEFRP